MLAAPITTSVSELFLLRRQTSCQTNSSPISYDRCSLEQYEFFPGIYFHTNRSFCPSNSTSGQKYFDVRHGNHEVRVD